MNKIFILIFLSILIAQNTFANHLEGGEIQLTQIAGLKYEVKLKSYRDKTQLFPGTSFSVNVLKQGATTEFNAVCTLVTTTELLTGFEQRDYYGIIDFPTPGTSVVSYRNCCRRSGILNFYDSGFTSYFIQTILKVDSSLTNSSSQMLFPPIILAQVNRKFQYNKLPFDADGDSLASALVNPFSNAGVPLSSYILPFSASGNPFSINSGTGEITWLPDSVGTFVASIQLKEFRNGIYMGEVRRDMIFIVSDSLNNNNTAVIDTSVFVYHGLDDFSKDALVGLPFYLTVTATDVDNDYLSLTMNGEPFATANNPAQVTSSNGNGVASTLMYWMPDTSQKRIKPYMVAVRTTEQNAPQALSKDFTFKLYVTGTLSDESIIIYKGIYPVYPNPAKDLIHIPFILESASNVNITLINMEGKIALKLLDQQMPAGNHNVVSSIKALAQGVYMLNYRSGDHNPVTQRIIITE